MKYSRPTPQDIGGLRPRNGASCRTADPHPAPLIKPRLSQLQTQDKTDLTAEETPERRGIAACRTNLAEPIAADLPEMKFLVRPFQKPFQHGIANLFQKCES